MMSALAIKNKSCPSKFRCNAPFQECLTPTDCSTDLGAIQGTWQDAMGNRFVLVADTGQSIASPMSLTVQCQGAEEKAVGLLRKECDRLGSRIIWVCNDFLLDLECIAETRFLVGDLSLIHI